MIIHLFHVKFSNVLTLIIGKHDLTSLMSMESIRLASLCDLHIACVSALDLMPRSLRRTCVLTCTGFLQACLRLACSYLCLASAGFSVYSLQNFILSSNTILTVLHNFQSILLECNSEHALFYMKIPLLSRKLFRSDFKSPNVWRLLLITFL